MHNNLKASIDQQDTYQLCARRTLHAQKIRNAKRTFKSFRHGCPSVRMYPNIATMLFIYSVNSGIFTG